MNDLDFCLEVASRSCQPLRYIRHWLSRKPLEIEAWFQRTTNRIGNGIWGIKWSCALTDDVAWPQRCCEAVRSAILATAWLLVYVYSRRRAHHTIYIIQSDVTSIHIFQWLLEYETDKHWNCVAHFRYRGSIEYRDTWDGIVIVAPISGIAQH